MAYPIVRSGGGYFARRKYRDLIWSNCIHILTTPYGTWPGRLDYGSRLAHLTFEPNDTILITEFQNETEYALNKYEGEILALATTVQADEHTIHASLDMRLRREPEAFTRGFVVARNQTLNILEVF